MSRKNCIYSYSEIDRDEKELEWFCKRHNNFTSPPFTIKVPIEAIENNSRSLISCEGIFDHIRPFSVKPANFFVASNRLSKLLPYLSGNESINLLSSKYLSLLIPQKRGVHLVTFQNGIMNTIEDFEDRGEAIWNFVKKHFPENPLCIGFYNPTNDNLLGDAFRAIMRFGHKNCGYIQRVALFFESLLGICSSVNRELRWIHISHSEGGAIAHLALRMVLIKQQHYKITSHHIANHLISANYGPLLPIPKHFALATFNSYSERDNTTWRFGKRFYGHPAYEIKLLPCESEKRPSTFLPPGDHDFLGKTYQKGLLSDLNEITRMLKAGEL